MKDATSPDYGRPPHYTPKVYQAICNVQADLAQVGISKDRKNQQQNYAFRGIDDLYAALAPLLHKHKLCILPRASGSTVSEHESKAGGKMFKSIVKVDFDFVSAEDGSSHTVTMYGESMDNSDKGHNKCASAAYKYACLQAFCVPTEGEDNDADATTNEVQGRKPPPTPRATPRATVHRTIEETLKEINDRLAMAVITPAQFIEKMVEWKKIDGSIPEIGFIEQSVLEGALSNWNKVVASINPTKA